MTTVSQYQRAVEETPSIGEKKLKIKKVKRVKKIKKKVRKRSSAESKSKQQSSRSRRTKKSIAKSKIEHPMLTFQASSKWNKIRGSIKHLIKISEEKIKTPKFKDKAKMEENGENIVKEAGHKIAEQTQDTHKSKSKQSIKGGDDVKFTTFSAMVEPYSKEETGDKPKEKSSKNSSQKEHNSSGEVSIESKNSMVPSIQYISESTKNYSLKTPGIRSKQESEVIHMSLKATNKKNLMKKARKKMKELDLSDDSLFNEPQRSPFS